MKLPILLLALAPAQITPPPNAFCADLRQIVQAASERVPFRSLESRREDQWLGGLAWCRRVDHRGASWRCHMSIGEVQGGRPGLAARTRLCLPDAVPTADEPVPDGRLRGGYSSFEIDRGRIEIVEVGGPRMHQGWYYTLTMFATR